ncbi:MAG: GGDEF domain-containing protein [Candidatus Omnitrophota bacterium]
METFLAGGVLVAVLFILFPKFLKRKKVRAGIAGGVVRSGTSDLIVEPALAGQKIVIEKSSHMELYSIKVSLFLSNPMPCEVIISKIFWTTWFSNLVHNGVSTREIVVPPQTSHFEVKLSDVVEERLFGALWEISKLASSGVQGFLDGKLFLRARTGPSSKRTFSQVFSHCGFTLEIRKGLAEKEKDATVLPKDLLTGFLTRQFLEIQCQSLIDTFVPSHVLSLMILDVDDFKSINDGHGHLVGDEVLRLLSREIRNFLKPEDFAIRYGGDEFVILLQDKGGAEAEKFANELRTAVSMISLTLETGQLLHFTISIGLVVINVRAPYTQWFKLADDVLRLAKKQGKNRLAVNRRAPDITF